MRSGGLSEWASERASGRVERVIRGAPTRVESAVVQSALSAGRERRWLARSACGDSSGAEQSIGPRQNQRIILFGLWLSRDLDHEF